MYIVNSVAACQWEFPKLFQTNKQTNNDKESQTIPTLWSTRLHAVRVRSVELVSRSGELVHDDVAKVGEIFEAFAEDFGCADAVCDVSDRRSLPPWKTVA